MRRDKGRSGLGERKKGVKNLIKSGKEKGCHRSGVSLGKGCRTEEPCTSRLTRRGER